MPSVATNSNSKPCHINNNIVISHNAVTGSDMSEGNSGCASNKSSVSPETSSITPTQSILSPPQCQKIPRVGAEKSVSFRLSSPPYDVLPGEYKAKSPATTTSSITLPSAASLPVLSSSGQRTNEDSVVHPPSRRYPGLVKDIDCNYKHFPHSLPDEERLRMKANSFRWIDYGFDTTRRFVGENLTKRIDERFHAATSLSRRVSVDGSLLSASSTVNIIRTNNPVHKPVWRQVQWLVGILHDDYDYKLLRRSMPLYLQSLIRSSLCFPHQLLTLPHTPLSQAEAVAVVAQVMDVRMQSEIMFTVRAIIQYCAKRS